MSNERDLSSIPAELFASWNFRWAVAGCAVSFLGDQLTLIALPWLILKLTGDPLALGTVLAVGTLPRVAFLLVGGALVDRHSPKKVLVITRCVNTGLMGALAALVFTGLLAPWMIYLFALATGLTSAFGYPAGNAILATTLPSHLLQTANSAVMGTGQAAALIGPALAGALIALCQGSGSSGIMDGRGLSLAFALDGLSFAFSGWTFWKIKNLASPEMPPEPKPMSREITAAIRDFWKDPPLRTLCLYSACVSFLLHGPVQVALPVLSNARLPGGAASFGLLMAAHGGGMLVGMGVAGAKPHWRLGTLGAMVLVGDALAGSALIPLGNIHFLWQGLTLLAPVGLVDGFIQVAVFTWIQRRISPQMLGRSMGLIMVMYMGLTPLSAAVTGALLRVVSPQAVFAGTGLLLVLAVAAGLCFTSLRALAEPVMVPSAEGEP